MLCSPKIFEPWSPGRYQRLYLFNQILEIPTLSFFSEVEFLWWDRTKFSGSCVLTLQTLLWDYWIFFLIFLNLLKPFRKWIHMRSHHNSNPLSGSFELTKEKSSRLLVDNLVALGLNLCPVLSRNGSSRLLSLLHNYLFSKCKRILTQQNQISTA